MCVFQPLTFVIKRWAAVCSAIEAASSSGMLKHRGSSEEIERMPADFVAVLPTRVTYPTYLRTNRRRSPCARLNFGRPWKRKLLNHICCFFVWSLWRRRQEVNEKGIFHGRSKIQDTRVRWLTHEATRRRANPLILTMRFAYPSLQRIPNFENLLATSGRFEDTVGVGGPVPTALLARVGVFNNTLRWRGPYNSRSPPNTASSWSLLRWFWERPRGSGAWGTNGGGTSEIHSHFATVTNIFAGRGHRWPLAHIDAETNARWNLESAEK